MSIKTTTDNYKRLLKSKNRLCRFRFYPIETNFCYLWFLNESPTDENEKKIVIFKTINLFSLQFVSHNSEFKYFTNPSSRRLMIL